MAPTEVAVVGGGIIGLSIASRLAGDGVDVTVIDEAPASGATGVAAGMLAPVTEVHYGEESLLRLNVASNEMYPSWIAELEEETGKATGYRASGTLMVARDGDDVLERGGSDAEGDRVRLEHAADWTSACGLAPRITARTVSDLRRLRRPAPRMGGRGRPWYIPRSGPTRCATRARA